jgi:hypothetical protein
MTTNDEKKKNPKKLLPRDRRSVFPRGGAAEMGGGGIKNRRVVIPC